MRKTWILAAALVCAAGCEKSPSDSGADAVTWSLIALEPPHGPGSEFLEPTTCGRMLRSSIVSGTITLSGDDTWAMHLTAWRQQLDDEPIACPKLFSFDISASLNGTTTRADDGGRELRLPDGTVLATIPFSWTPVVLTTIPLYMSDPTRLGPAPPFHAMTTSTWSRGEL